MKKKHVPHQLCRVLESPISLSLDICLCGYHLVAPFLCFIAEAFSNYLTFGEKQSTLKKLSIKLHNF